MVQSGSIASCLPPPPSLLAFPHFRKCCSGLPKPSQPDPSPHTQTPVSSVDANSRFPLQICHFLFSRRVSSPTRNLFILHSCAPICAAPTVKRMASQTANEFISFSYLLPSDDSFLADLAWNLNFLRLPGLWVVPFLPASPPRLGPLSAP